MVLWDYCAQRRDLIHNLTPKNLFAAEKQTPFEFQFGVKGAYPIYVTLYVMIGVTIVRN